jgi:hypothetical protein
LIKLWNRKNRIKMFTVAAMYCFTNILDTALMESHLKKICLENEIKGNLIVAKCVHHFIQSIVYNCIL